MSYMLVSKFRFTVFIIFISLFGNIHGQYNHELRTSFHSGFILKHRSFVRHLVNGPVRGFEINYLRPTNGSKQWHAINNFPDLGLGFSYYYLNNDKELGEVYSWHALLDLYLLRKEKYYATFRLSPGMTYASKIFDEKNNARNNFLSSRWSAFINLRWAFAYALSERLKAEVSLGIAHASNGALQQPNLGLNLITSSIGVRYQLNSVNIMRTDRKVDEATIKHIFQTYVAIGERESNQLMNIRANCATLSLSYYKGINHSNALGGGLDFYYKKYNKGNFDYSVFDLPDVSKIYYQIGVKLNYIYRAGNMDFPFEIGLYAFDQYKSDGILYNRFGMRYHIYKHLLANLTLKLHKTKADYIEWGLGYEF
jgi:hypothetical protein